MVRDAGGVRDPRRAHGDKLRGAMGETLRFLVNKHASTGASPVVSDSSAQLQNAQARDVSRVSLAGASGFDCSLHLSRRMNALDFTYPLLDSLEDLEVAGMWRVKGRTQRNGDVVHSIDGPRDINPVGGDCEGDGCVASRRRLLRIKRHERDRR